jgi:hypothetical protein
MYMLAPGMSGKHHRSRHERRFEHVFRRYLAQPGVRRDGSSLGSLPHWVVSTDVIYMGLGAAKNGFDLGFDQWRVEPVVQYQVNPWLSPYAGARYISVKGDRRGPQGRTGPACNPGGIRQGVRM